MLLLETKAGMPPREPGGAGLGYTELWEHILSASAGSSEGEDQFFSGSWSTSGKLAKMLTHFRPLVTMVTVLMKESLWVQSYLCALRLAPIAYTSCFFFFFFLIENPWRSVSGCGRRKEVRKHFELTSTLTPALLQDSWMAESK